MMTNPVRQKLLAGKRVIGCMAFEFFTPGMAAVLAAGGAEFIVLDMEHSGAGIDTIKASIVACRAAGIVALVRVPACEKALICPVLDAGAEGIMVPMVESAAQAQAMVEYCRYRPLGKRGLAFGLAHDRYRPGPTRATMAAANEAILTIAMIETAAGLRNAAAILGTPGIDLGWLGHFDLTDSMGIVGEFDHPRFAEAEAMLLGLGKPIGWLAGNGAEAKAGFARGFRAICVSTDIGLFRSAVAQEFAAALE
jgi:2-keto-3-deoxy-L-rhamnonate aldolase RhmA